MWDNADDLDATGDLDGNPDVTIGFYDTDDDGTLDEAAADTTGDGLVDVVGADTDHDGAIDVVGADTDGDGVGDWFAMDHDQDGAADVIVTVTEVGGSTSDTITWDSMAEPAADATATAPGADWATPTAAPDPTMDSGTAAVLDSVNAGMSDATAIYRDAMEPGSVDPARVDEAMADTEDIVQSNGVDEGLVTGEEMRQDAQSDMTQMQDTWRAEEAAAEVALDAERASTAADQTLGDG